jgi:hypothetical protein
MTTTVDGTLMTLFVNNPHTPFDPTWVFEMTSEYSQTPIINPQYQAPQSTLVTENERYMQFTVNVNFEDPNFKDKHTNGYYSWTLGPANAVIYSGFVKLITDPGGDLGTVDYVSNNEERESTVYYRPNY